MGAGGDLVHSVGEGISGLVAGSIAAVVAGIGTMIRFLQAALPGPLFPIVVGGVVVLFLVWLFRK
jgi:hypothetical protein